MVVLSSAAGPVRGSPMVARTDCRLRRVDCISSTRAGLSITLRLSRASSAFWASASPICMNPGLTEPGITWPSASGGVGLPGFSSIATSPASPTATTVAEASAPGRSPRSSETVSRTVPYSMSSICSTRPTCIPEIRTGEPRLSPAASANSIWTRWAGVRLLPLSQDVPRMNRATPTMTIPPTATSRL